MWEELKDLKLQFPLLEYLRRHSWTPRQIGSRQEFVGLCPLHREQHPSFYVNAVKNLFYCHGCHFIRSTAILGGLHQEYSFENVAA
jgi:hypothetical protein